MTLFKIINGEPIEIPSAPLFQDQRIKVDPDDEDDDDDEFGELENLPEDEFPIGGEDMPPPPPVKKRSRLISKKVYGRKAINRLS